MLKLKLDQLMFEQNNMSARQVAQLTDIRYSTILDLKSNQSKVWSPEHLNKLMTLFNLTQVDQLIEYQVDDQDQFIRHIEQQLEQLPPTSRQQILSRLVDRYGCWGNTDNS